MIEKYSAIHILEDIEYSLRSNTYKNKILSTINQYKKGLTIATDKELNNLINEYMKYDYDSTKRIELFNLINSKIQNIYSDRTNKGDN